MSITNGFAGVSNCYVFKSRLQEYAQKAGILTPVYETLKEGPSHEPVFRSTVIVDNIRYDSLPGFFNRKAAEQSAAEVALMEIAKSGNMNESVSHPVHETGLCKNLLQEYAQKMNFAIPSYVCHKDETPGKTPSFSCTVEIGGVRYIGAAARTKKEAEIKAARTALLAIQSHTSGSETKPNGSYQLTVLPCKKKGAESDAAQGETPKSLKPKKANLKKKWAKRKFTRSKGDHVNYNLTEQAVGNTENTSLIQFESSGMLEPNTDGCGVQHFGSELNQNNTSGIQVEDTTRFAVETHQNLSVTGTTGDSQNGQEPSLNFNQSDQVISCTGIWPGVQIKDLVTLVAEVNKVAGVGQAGQMGSVEDSVSTSDNLPSNNHLFGSNQIEDGRRVEGELKQNVGLAINASQDVYSPEFWSQ